MDTGLRGTGARTPEEARGPGPQGPGGTPWQVDVGGGPVHGVDFGGAGPTTYVLVHGLGGCHLNFLPAVAPLRAAGRVVGVDLPGFGLTPRAGRALDVPALAQVLAGVLERLGPGPRVLVGHSMGGLVSLAVAARVPEALAGLVLVAPARPPPLGRTLPLGSALRFGAQAVPGLGERLVARAEAQGGGRALVMDLLTAGCADVGRVPPDVVEAHVALLEWRRAQLGAGHVEGYLAALRALVPLLLTGRGRVEAWADAVRTPTLLVHGARDALVPFAFSRALARRRPDWAFAPVPDAGHAPMLEDGAGFAATLLAWQAAQAQAERRAAA